MIEITSVDSIRKSAREFVDEVIVKGGNRLIAFDGKMGAGKTTFIKAVCEELGVEDVITSPTFAIVNEYTDGQGEPVYHFDFYRIKRSEELLDMGGEEYFYSGCLCLMEWPDMVEEYLPEETLFVKIQEQENGLRTVSW